MCCFLFLSLSNIIDVQSCTAADACPCLHGKALRVISMGAFQYSDFLLYVMVLTAFMAQHAYEIQRKHEINIRENFAQRAICKNFLLCLYV